MNWPVHLQKRSADLAHRRTSKAFDALRRIDVMVKWAADRTELASLENEWRLLHALRSTRLARPVEYRRVGDAGGWMTVARTDARPISECGVTDARALLQIAALALEGLCALHRAGYVHGDVRPQNLLVRSLPDGYDVLWVDLEHAVPVSRLAAGFGYIGGWNAPSLERGEPQSGSTDLTALGRLLGEVAEQDTRVSGERGTAQECLRTIIDELVSRSPDRALLDAGEARDRLHELCRSRGVDLAASVPDAGPAARIDNRRARHAWDQAWPDWRGADRPLVIDLFGPAGCGKTCFLHGAAAHTALDGHLVFDMLDRHDTAKNAAPDWTQIERDIESREGNVLFLLTPPLFESLRAGLPEAARRGTIVVIERRGTTAEERSVPAGWQCERFPFPPFTAREWLLWANASF